MELVRPIQHFRAKARGNHLFTRLELRDERTYFKTFLKWLAPIYVSFSLVDVETTGEPIFSFLFIRIAMVVLATTLYLLLRGRVRYGLRLFLLTAPYIYSVEYLMIRHSLTLSPYFAGFALVLFVSTIFFPIRQSIALPSYFVSVAPVCIWYTFFPFASVGDQLNVMLMTVGTAVVCAANAAQLNRDLRKRLATQETLARDLGKRQAEIRAKANELIKRKAFESQFSPQIVSAVLSQGSNALEMSQKKIVTIVIDVVDSTTKAKTLEPAGYKMVIEEVFDVFASSCLRWNITVDKFTGDGAQAFAGAPVGAEDDFRRALMATKDTIEMLDVRSFSLRRKWKGNLGIRAAVCEGTALVGFLGKGSLKSFTAIGDTVSFTHRLCAASEPGKVAVYSLLLGRAPEPPDGSWSLETRAVSNLKGFGGRAYQIVLLQPMATNSILVDNGRCPTCETPLALEDGPGGLPVLICPGCIARSVRAA